MILDANESGRCSRLFLVSGETSKGSCRRAALLCNSADGSAASAVPVCDSEERLCRLEAIPVSKMESLDKRLVDKRRRLRPPWALLVTLVLVLDGVEGPREGNEDEGVMGAPKATEWRRPTTACDCGCVWEPWLLADLDVDVDVGVCV